MKRIFFLILSVLCLSFVLVSCKDEGNGSEENEKIKVMLSVSEGAKVIGKSSVDVEPGQDVSFEIKIEDGYYFKSVSDGEFDVDTGILTLRAVERRMSVSFFVEKADFDTTLSAPFVFYGEYGDSTNVEENEVRFGSVIKLKSTNADKVFLGWSFGKSFSTGGTIVSEDRNYDFVLKPELLKNGVMSMRITSITPQELCNITPTEERLIPRRKI